MIEEFAFDPCLLNDWERFRYLTEKFGVPEGRLISRYPKKWPKMVYESLENVSEMDRKRIEVRLEAVRNRKMMKSARKWTDSLSWQDNAETEQLRRPFRAIIAVSNPNKHEAVLTYSELDDDTPPWKVDREKVVRRTATDLCAAAEPLLRISREIVFIDPHFSPFKQRSTETLRAFLQCCHCVSRLELHVSYKDMNDFELQCAQVVGQHVPVGATLKVFRWREMPDGEGLHNRYILTERGGIRMAWGLDAGNPNQTDDVSLLSEEIRALRWEQYCGEHDDKPVFEHVETCEVRRPTMHSG